MVPNAVKDSWDIVTILEELGARSSFPCPRLHFCCNQNPPRILAPDPDSCIRCTTPRSLSNDGGQLYSNFFLEDDGIVTIVLIKPEHPIMHTKDKEGRILSGVTPKPWIHNRKALFR